MRRERDDEHQRFVNANKALNEATVRVVQLEARLKAAESKGPSVQEPSKRMGLTEGPPLSFPMDEARIREIVAEEMAKYSSATGSAVEVNFSRTLTEFNVSLNKEIIQVDEGSWIGKILARDLAGFFHEERGFGAIMGELERVYSASRTSGGTRDAVQKALEDLCAKGILERQQKANQWMYSASPEFKERVKKV
jgi:hypothetical protein